MRRSEVEALLASGVPMGRGEYDRTARLSTDSSGFDQRQARSAGQNIPSPPPHGQTPSSWGSVSKEESLAKGLRMPTTKEKWEKKRGDKKRNFQFPDYSTTEIRDAEMANATGAMTDGSFKYGGVGSYADSSEDAYNKTKRTLEERFGPADARFDRTKEREVRDRRQEKDRANRVGGGGSHSAKKYRY